MRSVNAEYRDGFLKPDRPLDLAQGQRVALIVVERGSAERWNPIRLASGRTEDLDLAEQGLDDWADALDGEDQE